MKTIKYLGLASPWFDTLGGSGLTWTTGMSATVSDDVANELLGYVTLFKFVADVTATYTTPQTVSGLVAVAGDSRNAFSSFPAALAQGCATAYHNGWFQQLSQMMGGALINVLPTAVSGTDVQSMATAQLAQILGATPRPAVVFEVCDVNNFYIAGASADFVIAQKCQWWRALAEAGIVCVTLNSTPYASSSAGGTGGTGNSYSTAKQAQQLAYLDWVNSNFARLFPGHVLVDAYSIAQGSDRTLAPGWSYDGIHPTWAYANAIAVAVKAAIAPRLNVLQALTPRLTSAQDYAGGSSVSNRRNMSLGSLIPGTIGQTTLPANWSVTSSTNAPSVALNLQPSPYGIGNQLQCVVPFSGAGDFAVTYAETFTAGTRLRAPHLWVPSFVADVAAGAGLVTGIDVRGMVTDGANTKYSFGGTVPYSLDTSGSFPPAVSQMLILGAPMQFSTNTMGGGSAVTVDAINSISVQCRVFTRAAGTVDFRISEPAVWAIEPSAWDLSGVTGAVTAHTNSGKCAIAAGGSSVVVTNNRVTPSSRVRAMVSGDASGTAWVRSVIPSAGAFTVNLGAISASTTVVSFEVGN